MAVAAKVRTGAVKGLTRSADIRTAVAAVQHVPAHIRPAVRRHIMRKAKGIKGASRHIPPHWHPSGAIRHVRPAQALALAEAAGVTLDLANDLDLAGKWKHGWIPLDAVAAAVKAKRYHGGGGEGRTVRGKGRAGSAVEARREQSRGRVKGALPTRGRTFSDAGEAFSTRREHGLPTGGRKARKGTPVGSKLELPEPQYVVPKVGEPSVRRVQDAAMRHPDLVDKHAGSGGLSGASRRQLKALVGEADARDRSAPKLTHLSDQESRGLSDRYAKYAAGFSDKALAAAVADPRGLSPWAHTALKDEIARRGRSVPPEHKDAARAAVRMKAPELRDRAGKGDKIAQAELDRRAGKRAERTKAATDRLQSAAQDRTRRVQNAQVAKAELDRRGMRSWSDEELKAAIDAHGSDTRLGTKAHAELERRGKPAPLRVPATRTAATKRKSAGSDRPPPGYAVVEDKVHPAPGYSQGTGRYSFTDPQGRRHYVGGTPKVAARRAHDHVRRNSQEKLDAFTRRASLAAAERKKQADAAKHRAIKIEHAPPATNEEALLMQQAAALHYSETSRRNVSTANVLRIAASDSPHITAESRAKAQELLPERGYEAAKQRLAGQSDEQLRQLRPKIAASAIPAHEKAGAERYIAERLAQAGRPKADAPPAESGAGGAGADVSRETSQASIRIEHSGDGTLVHGTERGDKEATAALKANGFKWSANLGAWYLPRNWSESTRAGKVQAVQSALGDRVAVDRGSVAKSTTAAERAAERTRRDAELAALHTAKAGQLSAEADRRFGAASAIADHIPMGQPVLVGHHSEGRHRRDLARIDSNMRAGVVAHGASKDAAHRASEAAARVGLATNPQALSRRIDRNSAELRKLDRILNGTGKAIHGQDAPHPPGEHRDRLEAMRAELADSIEHDRQTIAAAGAPQHGPATVKAGDYVRVRGSLLRVEKSNPKTITVKSHGLTLKYPYSEIQAHSTTENLLAKASDSQLQAFVYSKRGTPEAAVAQQILDERKRQAG